MLKNCYAIYDECTSRIRIGNSLIEKTSEINGSYVRTESINDKTNAKEWRTGAPLWQRCPMLGADENPAVNFTVTECNDAFGMKPHVKAVLELVGNTANVWYEYIVFPDVPFVFTQCFVEASGAKVDENGKTAATAYSGIETEYVNSADGELIIS